MPHRQRTARKVLLGHRARQPCSCTTPPPPHGQGLTCRCPERRRGRAPAAEVVAQLAALHLHAGCQLRPGCHQQRQARLLCSNTGLLRMASKLRAARGRQAARPAAAAGEGGTCIEHDGVLRSRAQQGAAGQGARGGVLCGAATAASKHACMPRRQAPPIRCRWRNSFLLQLCWRALQESRPHHPQTHTFPNPQNSRCR